MPYQEHPHFDVPNLQDKIWRYMDFTKFVSLLDKGALYFAHPETFEDPYEGEYTRPTLEQINENALRVLPDVRFEGVDPDAIEPLRREMYRKTIEMRQDNPLINCWCINPGESAAMWKLYCKSDEGIAIESTFQKMIEGLNVTELNVTICKVRYLNYENDVMPFPEQRYLYKRVSFEHERELRVITYLPRNEPSQYNPSPSSGGNYVPIDVNALIEKIWIAPTAQPWFSELAYSTLKRFNLDHIPLGQSTLYRKPN